MGGSTAGSQGDERNPSVICSCDFDCQVVYRSTSIVVISLDREGLVERTQTRYGGVRSVYGHQHAFAGAAVLDGAVRIIRGRVTIDREVDEVRRRTVRLSAGEAGDGIDPGGETASGGQRIL